MTMPSGSLADASGVDGEVLRALIRDVLADLLPAGLGAGEPAPERPAPPVAPPSAPPQAVPVTVPVPPVPAPAFPGPPGAGHVGASVPPSPVPPPSAPAQAASGRTVREQVDGVETVSLRSDADLDAFVRKLLHLFENPKHRQALRAGRLRFRLAASAVPGSPQPTHRVERGAVTEAVVRDAARAGARLVLGRRAVLTPLARDRARAAGVEIERER